MRARQHSHARVPASQAVAAALGLPAGATTVRIEVLGSADGAPVSRATSWFGADRFPDIADVYSQTGSVTQALARAGVADYRRVSTTVEARHADEAETDDLKLMPGAIVLVTRAVNVRPRGRAGQYSLTRFPPTARELLLKHRPRQKNLRAICHRHVTTCCLKPGA